MILVVVYEILVGAQEVEMTVGVDVHGTDKVVSIDAVCLGSHHFLCCRSKCHIAIDVGNNSCSHALTTLCIDENDTVCTACTINRCSVLEHLDVTDIIYINGVENVVVYTHVVCLTALLHIPDDTINDKQGLCVCIERVETADEHDVTDTWSS